MLKKRCHLHTVRPVTCFAVPIIGDTELNLTTEEIYKCLCSKAEVTEILKDGTRIGLDFSNYDKDNTPIVDTAATVETPKKAEAVTTVVKTEEEIVIDMNDKVEVKDEEVFVTGLTTDEVVEEETTEETVQEQVEEEIKPEVPVVDTVKDYTVASRNNNYPKKKAKNNK